MASSHSVSSAENLFWVFFFLLSSFSLSLFFIIFDILRWQYIIWPPVGPSPLELYTRFSCFPCLQPLLVCGCLEWILPFHPYIIIIRINEKNKLKWASCLLCIGPSPYTTHSYTACVSVCVCAWCLCCCCCCRCRPSPSTLPLSQLSRLRRKCNWYKVYIKWIPVFYLVVFGRIVPTIRAVYGVCRGKHTLWRSLNESSASSRHSLDGMREIKARRMLVCSVVCAHMCV